MYTLNLLDIKSEVKSKIHNTSLTSAQLSRWANITQDYIWTQADLKSSEYTLQFDTVSSQETYFLDANIGRILSMTNTTNRWGMEEVSEREMNDIDPQRNISGTPTRYSMFGKSEVSSLNPTASQITVVSNSALDTTQSVRIIGLVSNVETSENIALNGLAPATSTNTIDANGIIGVRLSATTSGSVTVTAGATTLVIIPSGKLFKIYQPVKLGPIPAATYTIRVNYIQGPRPMASDYDIPDLPPEFHSLIILGTLAQAHDQMYEFDIAETLYAKLDKQIDNLRRKDASIRGAQRTIKAQGIRSIRGKNWGRYPVNVTGS